MEDNISYIGNHTSAVGEIYVTLQHSLLQFLKTRNDMSKHKVVSQLMRNINISYYLYTQTVLCAAALRRGLGSVPGSPYVISEQNVTGVFFNSFSHPSNQHAIKAQYSSITTPEAQLVMMLISTGSLVGGFFTSDWNLTELSVETMMLLYD